MASALWRFWWLRGMLSEGRRHVTDALAGTPDDLSAARSDALRGASSLSLRQGDIIAAVEFASESERVAWQLQDLLAVARAQVALANAVSSNNEFERAEQLYESSAAGFRTLGQRWELGNVLLNSADLALNREQFAAAEKLATESLGIAREVRDDSGIAVNLGNIAFAALEQGDFVRARFLFQDALRHSRELDFTEWIAIMISGVAAADVAAGKFDTAAILLASAARIRGDIGVMSDSIERKVETRTREVVSSTLEPGRLAAASAEGERMSIDDAIELALDGAAGRAADARATKTQPASTNVTTWDRSP
jgi:non-specific serine/threonine protein kinase